MAFMSLVMFGLDGADPELVRKWEDELPNFQKLMKEGFFGDLESIMPPITVPAWACMLSSRTPNYFKVSHFQKMNPENYEREVVLSEAFRPEIIFDSDWESISYLIPGTTPAYSINGSMSSPHNPWRNL
jgi:predicted AlkP superfamily phosphohydrolase/phosphomutase